MNKEKMFMIRMDEELREKIRKAAKEKGLTSSAWVRMLVINTLNGDVTNVTNNYTYTNADGVHRFNEELEIIKAIGQ